MDEKFSLEKKLNELREVLEKMQLGNLDFDENIALFKQGKTIVSDCRAYLESAELMIEQLISDSEDG